MSSKVLIKMYNDLDIRCVFEKCKKVVKLIDLSRHEAMCQRAKCWNFDNCEGTESVPNPEAFPCCSPICSLLRGIVNCGGDQKKIYEELKKYFEKNIPISKIGAASTVTSIVGGGSSSIVSGSSITYKWDGTKAGQGIEITDGGQSVFLKEQSYVFRTVIAEAVPFYLILVLHEWHPLLGNRR